MYYLIRTLLFGTDLPGFPSLIVSVMFFAGVQSCRLGSSVNMSARIFAEVKRRPLYVVAERLGGAVEAGGSTLIRSDRRLART